MTKQIHRIITVAGTRPEIIRLCDWEEEIIFTGQHNDWVMGEQFLTDRPYSDVARSKTIHYLPVGTNTGDVVSMTEGVKEILKEKGFPDIIISHGDTRSALAGALAANQLNISLAHIEAGVRCFDETLYEERTRKQIDRMANYLFCPTKQAVRNLGGEGITRNVYFVGDVLYDSFLRHRLHQGYTFLTLHRQENVDNKERLKEIIEKLKGYSGIIFSVHPRTRKRLKEFGLVLPENVQAIEPLSYNETLKYIKGAKQVLTDSGGIQREAYWAGTPCEVLREVSEWIGETNAFGDGTAGDKIKEILNV